MWMMGYNDAGNGYAVPHDHHQFNNGSRKLRPLIPRSFLSSTPTTATAAASILVPGSVTANSDHHHLSAFNHHNHHLGSTTTAEQSKRDNINNNIDTYELNQLQGVGGAGVVVSSSRWNPTPEQLRTLEELYRRGTRTPSADQIQHITAQLRRYGKIEGKNVFYWFQNHKARERQKRRRQMDSSTSSPDIVHLRCPGEPVNGTSYEAGDQQQQQQQQHQLQNNKSWGAMNCTASEEAIPIPSCTRGGEEEALVVLHEEGRRSNFMEERNATWQHMIQLSCPPPLTPTTTTPTTTITTSSANIHHDASNITTPTSPPPSSTTAATSTVKLMVNKASGQHHHLNIFTSQYGLVAINPTSYQQQQIYLPPPPPTTIKEPADGTLELFPLGRSGGNDAGSKKDTQDHGDIDDDVNKFIMATSTADNNHPSNNNSSFQFFEFLPLKN